MSRANRPPRTLLDLRLLVRDALEEHVLKAESERSGGGMIRVLIGVSGGADSMALLHAAIPHRDDVAREVIVVHVNHRSRGEESDADEAFVRRAADSLGLRCEVRRLSAPSPDGKPSEAEWRAGRFAAFEEVAASTNADAILLAHHRDDLAETLLHRAVRGAVPETLAGMRPAMRRDSGLFVVRPFLSVTRDALRSILAAESIDWREDATNDDPAYLRTRLRADVMPLLEEAVSPAAREHLAALAEQLAGDAEYWATTVADWLREEPDAPLVLSRSRLRDTPAALRRRVLAEAWRRAVVALGNQPEEPTRTAILALDDLAIAPVDAGNYPAIGAEVQLPAGVAARRERGIIRFVRQDAADR